VYCVGSGARLEESVSSGWVVGAGRVERQSS
jgi:hypothetical protein